MEHKVSAEYQRGYDDGFHSRQIANTAIFGWQDYNRGYSAGSIERDATRAEETVTEDDNPFRRHLRPWKVGEPWTGATARMQKGGTLGT